MNSVYDPTALEALCRDAHRRKLFGNAFFKKGLPLARCLEQAPELAGQLDFQPLELLERHDSQRDGASKILFRCRADGVCVEAVVLRIATGRTSLCISSQAGCAAGCTFCATGLSGFRRNLSVAELLDQVRQAREVLQQEGRTLRNVVFMGMGEPFHNEANLLTALEALCDPRRFNLSSNHLLVSTAGVPDAMERCVKRFPGVRLALSLHSARQEVRERLMPIGRVHTLERLREVLPHLGEFMAEVLLLQGINDGPEEISALVHFLRGTAAHINLIQFNPYPGARYKPALPEVREEFGRQLRQAGFKVTLRYSLGDDIAAACGQLAARSGVGTITPS
jgi:23S rRNA (adenine2503-C2)-methyltransferase